MNETEKATAEGHYENQLVTFSLGEEEFGFNIMSVQEIIRMPKMARVPMAPDYLEGVANLRGMILPVIDTRIRFGMQKQEETDRTRVLVIDVDGVRTGLRVDQVRQVMRISSAEEEEPPRVVRGVSSDFLRGVVKMDGGKRIILDLDPKPICMINANVTGESHNGSRQSIEPSATKAAVANETTQIVSFRLGDEEYAFPMEKVREILRFDRPNEVPDAPAFVLGILTVRGNVLPVIDLRRLLGIAALHEELIGISSRLISKLQVSQQAIGAAFLTDGNSKIESQSCDDLLKWIMAFNTSNQTIMAIFAKIRNGLEKVGRLLVQAGHLARGADSPAARLYQAEAEPIFNVIISLLGEFKSSIVTAIHDDQRLVVIDSNGQLLALVVDKVREVLNVPKSLIDAPPAMGASNGHLSGIAKLNDGKRLIMLLEAQNIASNESMKKLTDHQTKPGGESVANQTKGGGSIAEEMQFVTFRLADGEYGIPISQIQEIDRYSKMTHIPNAPAYMEGICNLRGEIIPVINARKRFNLDSKDPEDRTRVIIMDFKGMKTGLLVDSVREVLNISSHDISIPPSTLSGGISQQYISGIGKVDQGKRMVVLLDVAKILE